ncbi:alpha/beta hydrolase [Paenibacillus hodogayensis]|uniref:Alpha/beta hydrolase n=1 Tax=Paenibacillus hodogayensis TaxID=279208 RepID=A0ABV5VTZ0_9BACL
MLSSICQKCGSDQAERFRFDPGKTVALGSSAGGHLAAMLATIADDDDLGFSLEMRIRDTRPQAAVLYCPATILHPADNFDSLKPSIEKLFGATEAEDAPYSEASPYDRIDNRTPTTLLIHGDKDDTIPLEHSVRFRNKLDANGVRAELVVLPNVPHGFGYGVTTPAQLESLAAIESFLRGLSF